MQISLNWLNELVDLRDLDVAQIAHELTMSGLEVEEVEEVRPKFTNIITAKIEKIENHPNSDHLHLVTVNTDDIVQCEDCSEIRRAVFLSCGKEREQVSFVFILCAEFGLEHNSRFARRRECKREHTVVFVSSVAF